ncbi:MAG: DUF4956 domain-containing protein [Bacteroidales bacterium]|jgi:hypothetical protein|nr:DUF4956 domain-containing protein [Bacteroidales bacterium]
MISINRLALLFWLFLLLFPFNVCMPQQTESDSFQPDATEQADNKEKKKEKKILEINEKFLISLGIDLLAVALIIGLIYYPNYRQRDYIFAFIMFNIVIFLLTFVLKYVKLSVGAAFGLFAVFSMLRYRTAGISMKDLTYLFIFIAMGVISAIQLDYIELSVLLALIFGVTGLLDTNLVMKRELSKTIDYENIEMIKTENIKGLMEDLKTRTGLNIHRISIEKINFLKDSARIKVFYYD